MMTRKTFIQLLGACGLVGVGAMSYMRWWEPFRYEVTAKDVRINRFASPLRILHLSDFHASESVSFHQIETAVDLALEQDADIAFLTGDFITTKLPDPQEYQRILQKLSERMPVFACIGNHDGGRWSAGTAEGYRDFSLVKDLLERSGITLLFNQAQQVMVAGKRFTVAGLGDTWSGDTRPEQTLVKKVVENDGGVRPEAIFVLSHNPDCKTDLLAYDWDLMCCGHTHGGQLVIPVLGWRPFLPVRDTTFAEGLWSHGRQQVHLTRGVGNLHGMRFNCRPEISILNVM